MRITHKIGGSTRAAGVDEIVSSLQTIDVLHHEIHEGGVFSLSRMVTAFTSAANYAITIRTSPNKEPHLTWSISASGQVQVSLNSGASISGTGTAIVPRNHRGASTKISQAILLADTSSTGGTALGTQEIVGLVPGGQIVGNQVIGGAGGQRDEWVLSTGSTYVLNILNDSGTAITLNVAVEYYEEVAP